MRMSAGRIKNGGPHRSGPPPDAAPAGSNRNRGVIPDRRTPGNRPGCGPWHSLKQRIRGRVYSIGVHSTPVALVLAAALAVPGGRPGGHRRHDPPYGGRRYAQPHGRRSGPAGAGRQRGGADRPHERRPHRGPGPRGVCPGDADDRRLLPLHPEPPASRPLLRPGRRDPADPDRKRDGARLRPHAGAARDRFQPGLGTRGCRPRHSGERGELRARALRRRARRPIGVLRGAPGGRGRRGRRQRARAVAAAAGPGPAVLRRRDRRRVRSPDRAGRAGGRAAGPHPRRQRAATRPQRAQARNRRPVFDRGGARRLARLRAGRGRPRRGSRCRFGTARRPDSAARDRGPDARARRRPAFGGVSVDLPLPEPQPAGVLRGDVARGPGLHAVRDRGAGARHPDLRRAAQPGADASGAGRLRGGGGAPARAGAGRPAPGAGRLAVGPGGGRRA